MKKKLLSLLMITTAMLLSACGSSDSTQAGGDVANVGSVGHESNNTVNTDISSIEDVTSEDDGQNEEEVDPFTFASSLNENIAEDWGTCGENLTWYYAKNILVIRGTGEMDSWGIYYSDEFGTYMENDERPWANYVDDIQYIFIEDGCTSIGMNAFSSFISLNYIAIPDSLTIIEDGALKYTGLTSIILPDSITSIGNFAFYDCGNLSSISIPNSVTSIGKSAFRECEKMTNIIITDSVTVIGERAFEDCKNLTDIIIPNSITIIEPLTFYNCRSLSNITIPDSVTAIGECAFESCLSLTSIVIPDNVTTIGAGAFRLCQNLKSITLSNSITAIEQSTFSSCESLSRIVIPDGVTTIGESAFYGCKSLTASNIKIPESVTKVESGAFTGFEINELYIPNTDANVARDVVDDGQFYIIGNTMYYRNGNSREVFSIVEHYIDEDGNDRYRMVQ